MCPMFWCPGVLRASWDTNIDLLNIALPLAKFWCPGVLVSWCPYAVLSNFIVGHQKSIFLILLDLPQRKALVSLVSFVRYVVRDHFA